MNLTEELKTKDALVAVGKSIDEDRKLGTFGQPGTEAVVMPGAGMTRQTRGFVESPQITVRADHGRQRRSHGRAGV